MLRNLIGTHMNHLACSLVKDPWWKRRGVRAASASSSASTGRSDCSWSTCDRSTSRTRSLVHAAGAVGVEGWNRLDRILCPVREEALAPEARRRGPRGRHHGQDRAQRSLVDVGEANMKQYREIGHKSNTRAPVQMLTPVPTRNNGGAVS